MRIFADHCLPRSLVNALRDNGHNVKRALEAGLHMSPDEDIFNYARKTRRLLLTVDKDFLNTKRFDVSKSWGILVIILDNMSKEAFIRLPVQFLGGFKQPLKGQLLVLGRWEIKTWPGRIKMPHNPV